ncbi:MAG: hypothetical protein QXH20_04355 [Candidatus Bathyarchaeia archaeon]
MPQASRDDILGIVLQFAMPYQDDIEEKTTAEVLRLFAQPKTYPAGTSGLYQIAMDLAPLILLARTRRKARRREAEWKRLQHEVGEVLGIYERWRSITPEEVNTPAYRRLLEDAMRVSRRITIAPLRALLDIVTTTPPSVRERAETMFQESLIRDREIFRQQVELYYAPLRTRLAEEARKQVELAYEPQIIREKQRALEDVAVEMQVRKIFAAPVIEALGRTMLRVPATHGRMLQEAAGAIATGDWDRAVKTLQQLPSDVIQPLNEEIIMQLSKVSPAWVSHITRSAMQTAGNWFAQALDNATKGDLATAYQMVNNALELINSTSIQLPEGERKVLIEWANKATALVADAIATRTGIQQFNVQTALNWAREARERERQALQEQLSLAEEQRMRALFPLMYQEKQAEVRQKQIQAQALEQRLRVLPIELQAELQQQQLQTLNALADYLSKWYSYVNAPELYRAERLKQLTTAHRNLAAAVDSLLKQAQGLLANPQIPPELKSSLSTWITSVSATAKNLLGEMGTSEPATYTPAPAQPTYTQSSLIPQPVNLPPATYAPAPTQPIYTQPSMIPQPANLPPVNPPSLGKPLLPPLPTSYPSGGGSW